MKNHARVAIIGGGVMGVSLLYHLAKRGCSDAVLIEKNELTAGSTWHAAGLCTHFAHNPTIMEMRAASVRLYGDILPRQTGQSAGFHPCGALRITRSPDRMDEFRQVQGLGRFLGYQFNILTPHELKDFYPLCHTDGIIGAIHEPDDGHVDPALAVNAMAQLARENGAEIHRRNSVQSIAQSAAGEWTIETSNGRIQAEHIVNAAGTWCREIGGMMGLDLPVVPVLHQYLVTGTVREVAGRIAGGENELPMIRDPEESWYVRQERDGMIVGPYEKSAQPWSIDGVPPEFGMELLPPDLQRIEPIVARAIERIPCLAEAGIKTVVNGPITFTPDANPLIGPAFGLRNAWLMTGSSMGVMEGGGAGEFLSSWIIDGQPPRDALTIDPRRFGDYAGRDYRIDKAVECFGLQFGIHFPFEERPAGRPQRVSPIHDRLAAAGAVFGCAYGWERPNWFCQGNPASETELTFRRPGWIDAVTVECQRVQESVALADLSAFSKFEVNGRRADEFLATLGANRPPQHPGQASLVHALTDDGGIDSEFTAVKLDENHFHLTSAAAAERHDEDLLRARAGIDVEITNVTQRQGIIAVMGPRSRDVLENLTGADLSDDVFPWLSAASINVAGIALTALRVSYIGEPGWELHCPVARMLELYDSLVEAGSAYDIGHFGAYAMNAMRLEKGYRAWGVDLTTERTPLEAGLVHLVKTQGRDFIGRSRLLERHNSPDAWRMELLELDVHDIVWPFATHTVLQDDTAVGMVTSAAFGPRTGKFLALAYLTPDATGSGFCVRVLHETVRATVLDRCPYDPDNLKLRQLEESR